MGIIENINNVHIIFSSRDTLDNFKLPVMIFFLPSSCTLIVLVTNPVIVWLCSVTGQLPESSYTTEYLGQKTLLVLCPNGLFRDNLIVILHIG